MGFGNITLLLLVISIGISGCVIDFERLGFTTPTLDSASARETEHAQAQVVQNRVGTAVAATLTAMPTKTPLTTETPVPTKTATPTQVQTPISGSTRVAPPDRFDISTEGQPSLGPENAPIIIVEFSDFNCGFCRKWHQETFQPLLDTYPQQIRFVYRDDPILSEESFNAAVAAQCAYEQGAFWEYHDRLFTRNEAKNRDTYLLFAGELGLQVEIFETCLDGEGAVEEVLSDAEFATGLGIRGTPTFFINGIPLVGAQPIEQFLAIVDRELGK